MNTYDEEFWAILDTLLSQHKIIIDRPKGSKHPKHPNIIYKHDYGYIDGTASADGGGIDVWVGSSGTNRVDAVITSIDAWKKDSEIKILVSCTDDEIQDIYMEHNSTSGMKGLLNLRFPRERKK